MVDNVIEEPDIPVYNPTQTTPKPSEEVAQDRASKVSFGLKNKVDGTFDDFYKGIINGTEPQLRDKVANQLTILERQRRAQALDETVKALGRPITYEEYQELDRNLNYINRDPKSVFEEEFAKRYMNHLNWQNTSDPDNDAWTVKAQSFIPKDYRFVQETGEDVIRTREYINTLHQDQQDKMHNQSWPGWGTDIGMSFIPGVAEYRMRNLGGAGFLAGGLRGENIEENALKTLSLPWEERKAKIKSTVDELNKHNFQWGAQYLETLLGQTRAERYLNNAFSGADIATFVTPGMKFSKAVMDRMILGKTAVTNVKNMVRGIETQARTAQEAAAAASGDMDGAAFLHTKSEVMSALAKGDPRQQAIDHIYNFFKGKINDLYENVGTGNAMGLVRAIRQRYLTAADNIVDRLSNLVQTAHVPEKFFDDLIAHYRTEADRHFPGLSNSILDFSVPFRAEIANRWFFNIHIGNNSKQYFDTPQAAAAFGNFHGINKDFTIHAISETLSKDELTAQYIKLGQERKALEFKANDPTRTDEIRNSFAKDLKAIEVKMDKLHGRILNFGVEGHGSGYYIRITKPIDLTQSFIRNAVTKSSKVADGLLRTPDSYLTAILGKVRSPEETLSEFQRRNRGLAVHGPNALMELAHSLAEDIANLSKGTYPLTNKRQMWKDFEHVLSEQQKIPDPVDGVPGYTFRNIAELQLAYMRHIGRLPEPEEVKAYWAQKMLYEFDHVLRNVSIYRNKAGVGAETHTISALDKDGKRVLSDAFDGVGLTNTPRSDGNVLIVDRQTGKWIGGDKPTYWKNVNKKTRAFLTAKIADGQYKVVRIYDEYANPLKGYSGTGGHSIRYVVAPATQLRTDPLSWNQLPERGGGHFIYNHPQFIKQAKVDTEVVRRDREGNPTESRYVYKGDTTVMGIPVRAMGQDVVNKINAFRVLLRDKKVAEAKQYLLDNPVGIDYGELAKWFKELPRRNSKTGRMEKVEPWLNINEPLQLVERNKLIGDLNNDLETRYHNPRNGRTFVNGTRVGSFASQRQVAFTGERDSRSLMSMYDIGGAGNPIYKYAPAELLSPINALNRGISAISNSFFMDEYRFSAVEHWLREAQPFLNLKKNELEQSPHAVFNNPRWKNTDKEGKLRIDQLEVARYQINSLTGMGSDTNGVMHVIAQRLADVVYNRLGPNAILDPIWIARNLSDPARFIRSLTFHAQLGLFNLPQYVRQLQTFSIIFGTAGFRHAGSGTLAAVLHSWTGINNKEEIINGLDRQISRHYIPGMSNWKPGEFREATDLARDSGFFVVAGEHALRDNEFTTKTISKGGARFLDAGTMFFTAGERMVRRGAFFTAFREFRDAHPTGALSQSDKLKIVTRARDLNVNMDRAANSIYQKGLSSIPLQFLTYQMRTMDLFTGKRLDWKTKAKLFGVNALLYGAAGTSIAGFPFGDFIKDVALRNGYQVGDGYIQDTLMQGVPASILAAATGNWYSIGDTLGPQGWEPLREALRGDRTVWSLALGAVGTTMETAWQQSDGLRKMAMSAFADDESVFPFVPEDVLDVFNTLSSVYHIGQTGMAINTGNWVSRKGVRLDKDITPLNAIFMYLAGGLSPEKVSNINVVTQALNSRKEDQKKVEQFFMKEYRRGIEMAQAGPGYNPDEAKKHFQRAFTSLRVVGYPMEDWDHLLSLSEQGYETLADRVSEEFWTKHVYTNNKQLYNDAYVRHLRRKFGNEEH